MSETPDPTRLLSVQDFCTAIVIGDWADVHAHDEAQRALVADLQAENARLTAALVESQRLHCELLYQVATKHPNETRHETARRYIQQHENHCNKGGPCAALTPKGETP